MSTPKEMLIKFASKTDDQLAAGLACGMLDETDIASIRELQADMAAQIALSKLNAEVAKYESVVTGIGNFSHPAASGYKATATIDAVMTAEDGWTVKTRLVDGTLDDSRKALRVWLESADLPDKVWDKLARLYREDVIEDHSAAIAAWLSKNAAQCPAGMRVQVDENSAVTVGAANYKAPKNADGTATPGDGKAHGGIAVRVNGVTYTSGRQASIALGSFDNEKDNHLKSVAKWAKDNKTAIEFIAPDGIGGDLAKSIKTNTFVTIAVA